jgi:endonuclease/exonuclease/phosphatase family metal-dependent hydrolase
VAVAADVEGPFGPLTVATTHLSFVPGWNVVQLRRLVRALGAGSGPLLLTGDLNLEPPRPARAVGLRSLAAAHTFPVDVPVRQLDHVLARGRVRATGAAEAPQLPLSDHRPLVVPVGGVTGR